LPPLFKRFNYRHVSSLETHEYDQMHFHINHVLNLDENEYLSAAKNINVPVLFMNGEWDEYTAPADARLFERVVKHSTFTTIRATGHFLDMEHKAACRDSRFALLDYLTPQPTRTRQTFHYRQAQTEHAFAL